MFIFDNSNPTLEKYYEELYKQYKSAMTGAFKVDELGFYDDNFQSWIEERQAMLEMYNDLLNDEFDFDTYNYTEINKGFLDTLVKDERNEIISRFAKTMNIDNCTFEIDGNRPLYVEEGLYTPKFPNNLLIVTHNPYLHNVSDYKQTLDLSNVHNGGMYNVVVGVFGDKKDLDREFKSQFLNELSLRMTDDNKIVRAESQGNYYEFIRSKRKQRCIPPYAVDHTYRGNKMR